MNILLVGWLVGWLVGRFEDNLLVASGLQTSTVPLNRSPDWSPRSPKADAIHDPGTVVVHLPQLLQLEFG